MFFSSGKRKNNNIRLKRDLNDNRGYIKKRKRGRKRNLGNFDQQSISLIRCGRYTSILINIHSHYSLLSFKKKKKIQILFFISFFFLALLLPRLNS
jgi:hypothetical protein